jgi:hypothetical protein
MRNSQVRTVSSEINHSLSLIERVVLYNISLYNNVEDKINYLENFYGDLIKEVFTYKKYIVETFKYRYSGKIIVETKKDVKEKIYEFHSFIKRAIKFDYLNEQQNQTAFAPPKSVVGYQATDVAGNATTMGRVSSTKVLSEIGWDKFFNTFKDGLSSSIYSIASEYTTYLFPALSAGFKIAGSIGWGVLFIWDLYKNKTGEAIIDFFLGLCQFIPSVLGNKADKLRDMGKRMVGSGVKTVDVIISEIMEKLGFKEILGKFWAIILEGINKFLGILKQAAVWIEKQFNNAYTFFSQMLTKCSAFIQTIKKSLEKFANEGLQNVKNDVSSVITTNKNTQANTTAYTPKYDTGKI